MLTALRQNFFAGCEESGFADHVQVSCMKSSLQLFKMPLLLLFPFFLLKPAKWFMPRKESAIGFACYAVAVNRGVRWKALPSFDAPSCERQLLIRSNALLYISVCYKE